jgi:FlaA1/EpsC-like NDP-sugar epimerase
MLSKFFRTYFFNRWVAFIHDLLWIPLSLFAAYSLRFNFDQLPKPHASALVLLMVVSIPIQGITYQAFGLYRGVWRFASIPDIIRIVKAVCCATLVIFGVLFLYTRLAGIPRSVLFLYPMLLIAGLTVPRLVYRWFKERHVFLHLQEGQRVVIVGAGQAGELLLRDLLRQPDIHPVAFIDDDPKMQGREIHGVRVLGTITDLDEIVFDYFVQEILIAIPSASRESMQRIITQCELAAVPFRVLPALHELTDEQVGYGQLRPVTLEDLLGRDPIQLDMGAITSYLQNKTVLVTGGGGSIGSELCRQVAAIGPSRLVIFDHGEYNLYAIDHELRQTYPELELTVALGDVKDQERVDWVFKTFRPNVVFHAAAYKHVPMVEINPAEGVRNNVLGSCTIADAAEAYKADQFVLVSTDKAVNPANVMGTTKRIAELYCQNLDKRSETKFITTRFGNVLGSAGSVVPLFQKQIEAGGPVTVTHPEITRYFMTIPESVSLILQAGSMGQGSEIFVLDMGEPVLIKDLAEQMIRLSGLEPGKDVEIVYTGLRPGEKLFEEILHKSEGLKPTTHPKLLLAKSRHVDWRWLAGELACLGEAALSRDVDVLKKHLHAIVPEYKEQ